MGKQRIIASAAFATAAWLGLAARRIDGGALSHDRAPLQGTGSLLRGGFGEQASQFVLPRHTRLHPDRTSLPPPGCVRGWTLCFARSYLRDDCRIAFREGGLVLL